MDFKISCLIVQFYNNY